MQLPRPPAGRRTTSVPPVRRTPEGRIVAIGRDGRELSRRQNSDITPDQFDVPASLIERDWSLQWVAAECLGKEISGQLATMRAQGWDFVPARRAPGHFHSEEYDGPIYREGQYLMERPRVLTDEAERENIAAAKRQKYNQASAFKGVDKILDEVGARGFEASNGSNDARGVAKPRLVRSVEGVPTNLYPKYENTVDAD